MAIKALAFAILAALLAASACSDEPPPWDFFPELPPNCTRDQRLQRLTELADLEQRFTLLARQTRAPNPTDVFDGDLPETALAADEMLASLRDVLARPCLAHAAPLLPLPEYARWRSLTFAVENGLFRALRDMTAIHRIHGKRAMAVPPELLPEPDLTSRIELRSLACPQGSTARCVDSATALAPLTAELMSQEAELREGESPEDVIPVLELAPTLHRHGSFEDGEAPLTRLCGDRWLATWQSRDLSEWMSCVQTRAPRQLRYHAPEQLRSVDGGWIALRSYYGHYADDYTSQFFDLATGAAYVARGRDMNDRGPLALRSGRIPAAEVRRLALALLARPALVRVRAAPLFVEMPPPSRVSLAAYDIAKDLEEDRFPQGNNDRDDRGLVASSDSSTSFVIADGATLRYESAFRSVTSYGTSLFANQQLDRLAKRLDPACAPASFPSIAALAPTPPPPPEAGSWACLPSRIPDTFRYIETQLAEFTPSHCH